MGSASGQAPQWMDGADHKVRVGDVRTSVDLSGGSDALESGAELCLAWERRLSLHSGCWSKGCPGERQLHDSLS